MKKLIVTTLFVASSGLASAQTTQIDLSGQWLLGKEAVHLPGTTDTNRKGEPNKKHDETTHLSRFFTWFGEATYSKSIDIPSAWKNKRITLFLERTKPTTIYIDGVEIGKCDDISVPQVYDLTGKLAPGQHLLDIKVDNGNSVPKQLLGSSHAYTEDTQTNWNGIIGKMYLEAKESPVTIKSIRTAPIASKNKVNVEVTLECNPKLKYNVKVSFSGKQKKKDEIDITRSGISQRTINEDGTTTLFFTYNLGENAKKWSEHTPQNINKVKVRVECKIGRAHV